MSLARRRCSERRLQAATCRLGHAVIVDVGGLVVDVLCCCRMVYTRCNIVCTTGGREAPQVQRASAR